MSLLAIIIALAILGVLLWGVSQLPMDPTIRKVITVVVVVVVCIWLLQSLGGFGGFDLRLK